MVDRKSYSKPKALVDYVRLIGTGFAMGTADIIPGVSGGTMAFIMGVYEDLIAGIKSFDIGSAKLLLRGDYRALSDRIPWRFLCALGAGILLAIVTLAKILSDLLHSHPTFVFAFFGGLILASIIAIGARVEWNVKTVATLLLGAVVAFVIVGLNPTDGASHSPLVLFGSGMIAISAMILPGISGSFILLILGQYEYVIRAVHERDLFTVAVVAAGCGVGLLLFCRILSYLLRRFYVPTVTLLTGFMLGSLRVIWERAVGGIEEMSSFGVSQMVGVLALVLLGFVVVSVLDHLQSRDNPVMNLLCSSSPEVS